MEVASRGRYSGGWDQYLKIPEQYLEEKLRSKDKIIAENKVTVHDKLNRKNKRR